MTIGKNLGGGLASALVALMVATPAFAQSVEEFYAGRTVDFYVGAAPGGAFDIIARPLSEYMSRHIPGNPEMVLRHMPGGSGVVMANHLYNIAPRDGSAIALGSSNVVMEPRLRVLTPDGSGLQYEVENFNWIGSPIREPHVTWIWSDVGVQSAEDAMERPVMLGATSPAADNAILPWIMNDLIGTQFDVTVGYDGQAAISNAVEQGEMEGNNTSLTNIFVTHWNWVQDGSIDLIIQYGAERHSRLPDVPTAIELARNDEDRALLEFYALKFEMQQPVMAPPEVPEDRVAALRQAFEDTVNDPEFIAALGDIGMEVNSMTGAEVEEMIAYVMSVPEAIPERIRSITQAQSQ